MPPLSAVLPLNGLGFCPEVNSCRCAVRSNRRLGHHRPLLRADARRSISQRATGSPRTTGRSTLTHRDTAQRNSPPSAEGFVATSIVFQPGTGRHQHRSTPPRGLMGDVPTTARPLRESRPAPSTGRLTEIWPCAGCVSRGCPERSSMPTGNGIEGGDCRELACSIVAAADDA